MMSVWVNTSKEHNACLCARNKQPELHVCTLRMHTKLDACMYYANLPSFQANLESVWLLAYSGGHSDI